jgi:hypothetical protein
VSNGNSANNQANLDYSGNSNIAAGGGGASSAGLYDGTGNALDGYTKPAWQQQFETSAGIAADHARDLPDVSLFAANGMYGALWATCRDNDCQGTNPTITGVGGTSASAPAFAGVLALINQKVGAADRLGQPNWILYALAKTHPEAFHRIASGNNSVVCTAGTPNCAANGFMNGYNAGSAYNLATGLGSVDIASLVSNWTSVGKAQTSVSLTLSSTTFQHGQPIQIGVGVNPSAATGNVALSNDISARGLFGSSSQLTLPLINGQASSNWAAFPGGTYNVYASYGGDATYGSSISTPVEITVTPEDSVLRLSTSSVDGSGRLTSVARKTVSYGTYVSIDAQPVGKSQSANANPLTNATGTITFADSAASQAAQGSGMLDATGNAEFPTHYFGVGTHAVTASYWGDSSYNASTSVPVSFIVQKAGTVAAVTTSANSIDTGTLTITAAIRPGVANFVAPPPNGTVTFTDATNGTVLGTASAATVARDPATGAYYSTASLDVPVTQLVLGSNNIVASYNGDADFLPSAASTPAVVACTAGCGNGTGQSLTLSFTQGTSTAAAGSNANVASTMMVSVLPGGGFTGAVKLSCTVSGSKSDDVNIPTCSFNPGTVTITNAQSVPSTLTVTSTPAGVTTAASDGHIWSMARGGAMLACVLIFGLPGRRRSLAVFRVLLCAIALGTILGGTTGCGAGNSTSQKPSTTANSASTGTTPDRYTVTFRAVDTATGTLTAQDNFTVTVQ